MSVKSKMEGVLTSVLIPMGATFVPAPEDLRSMDMISIIARVGFAGKIILMIIIIIACV